MSSKDDDDKFRTAGLPGAPPSRSRIPPPAAAPPRPRFTEPRPAPSPRSRISEPEPGAPPASRIPASTPSAVPAAELNENKSDFMPADLRDQLLELEEWAGANKGDAVRDSMGFWGLKLPAILASASAGVWAHFDLTTVSVFAGAIASLCVIIDGIHPRGMLRNTHLRAYHDIRIMISGMVADWRSRSANAKDENIARKIIREAESERQRIAAYIRDAETALNYKSET
jgi:hypothetical protein